MDGALFLLSVSGKLYLLTATVIRQWSLILIVNIFYRSFLL
jgi:hypothetical protein